jgi:branched-chain amino acid transport system ATP-binding protein
VLIVLVEHNVRFLASIASEVVVLDFGRKIFAGKPRDAIADPAVIAAFTSTHRPDGAPASLATGAARA